MLLNIRLRNKEDMCSVPSKPFAAKMLRALSSTHSNIFLTLPIEDKVLSLSSCVLICTFLSVRKSMGLKYVLSTSDRIFISEICRVCHHNGFIPIVPECKMV